MKIKQCTVSKPVTCQANSSITDAVKKLKKYKLRHLYVTDKKKKLLGIFSGIDVVYNVLSEGRDYRKMKVGDVMNEKVVAFAKDQDLIEAIGFMSSTNILSCPVLEKEKLVGVLSYRCAVQEVMKQKAKKQKKPKAVKKTSKKATKKAKVKKTTRTRKKRR